MLKKLFNHLFRRLMPICIGGGLMAGLGQAQLVLQLQPNPLTFTSFEANQTNTPPDANGDVVDSKSGTITLSGVTDFTYAVQINPSPKNPNNYNWLTVSRPGNGLALTVTVTQTYAGVQNPGDPGTGILPRGEYSGEITITAGTTTRFVPVQFQVFPSVSLQLTPPSPMKFPANGSFAAQTISVAALQNDQNGALPDGVVATVSFGLDTANPDSVAVQVDTISAQATNATDAQFSVSVNTSLLSAGDHSILVTFTNSITLERVYLNAAVSIPAVTVSGSVRAINEQPLPGAEVQFTAGVNVSTDSSGNYSASLPSGYSGTETVSLNGYTFDPPSYSFSNLTGAVTGRDFVGTAAPHTISGYVTTAQELALTNVSINFTGGPSGTTDGKGYYQAAVPTGYTGTATPQLAGYTFSPASRSYTSVASDFANENYTATQIPASRSQVGVYRNGVWFVDWDRNRAWDPTDAAHVFAFGLPGDLPVMGDWNHDGRMKFGVYRNGLWFVDWNGNGVWDATDAAHVLAFGLPGDLPVMGDWNGDGRMKVGVYRNGLWFVDWNGNGVWDPTDAAHVLAFGLPGDLPVMGDWNGDGRLKIGVFRNGQWFVDWNGNGVWDATDAAHVLAFGLPRDRAVVGDWNGDGRTKFGVYRNGLWFVDWNGNGVWDSTDAAHVLALGLPGDLPVIGNWSVIGPTAGPASVSPDADLVKRSTPGGLREALEEMRQQWDEITEDPTVQRRLLETQTDMLEVGSHAELQTELRQMQIWMEQVRQQAGDSRSK